MDRDNKPKSKPSEVNKEVEPKVSIRFSGFEAESTNKDKDVILTDIVFKDGKVISSWVTERK
jgi:hypothetical protein